MFLCYFMLFSTGLFDFSTFSMALFYSQVIMADVRGLTVADTVLSTLQALTHFTDEELKVKKLSSCKVSGVINSKLGLAGLLDS